jgi:hypothetical protein
MRKVARRAGLLSIADDAPLAVDASVNPTRWRASALVLASVVAALTIALVGAPAAGAEALSKTFNYTGAEQTFTVPEGVTSVHVVATGARGFSAEEGPLGGRGAVVSGDLSVTAGETLYAEVGGLGERPLGGFNGGGKSFSTRSGGGGGASDVRTTTRSEPPTFQSRLLVAAGGGGAGGGGVSKRCIGGAGGDAGTSGAQGGSCGSEGGTGGGAGTETAGGLGGEGETGRAKPGGLGGGGNGEGGGGGGGLYGGGGGGSESEGPHTIGAAGGGGGGSNLVPEGGTAALDENGAPPQITISYSSPPTVTEVQPSDGPPAGGTHVTITGTNFAGVRAVKFGSVNATRFRVRSPTSITAVAPPGAETVFVTVSTPGDTSPLTTADQFTYATPGEWTLFPSPNVGSLSAASCLPSGFCVAVGSRTTHGVRGEEPLMESWDGTEWSVVPVPAVPEKRIELVGSPATFAGFHNEG